MKISYRNSPGIRLIDDGFFMGGDKGDPMEMQKINLFRQKFGMMKKKFLPITVLSSVIRDTIIGCSDKMLKEDLWKNVGKVSGTFIDGFRTYCYDIEATDKGHNAEIFHFIGLDLCLYICHNSESQKVLVFIPSDALKILEKIGVFDEITKKTFVDGIYFTVIASINFLKYADVQDKVVKANSRLKDISCKYVNDTKCDIHYVNSNYITNLYVQGAFKVSGHWRFQPKKKNSEWTKELIWINEFQKEGYTRKAEILNEHGKEQPTEVRQ